MCPLSPPSTPVPQVANELFTIKKVVAGLKAKQGIVQDRGLPWDHFTSHIAKVSEEFEARKEQFNAMVSSPDADESVLVPYYHQLMADGQRIEQLNNFREPHFAPDLVLLPLLGACTHFEGNERNTKGGSAEPVAHDFNFTVCLFDRVTQQELPEKATPTQKPGGSDFDDDDAVDEPGYGGAEAQPSEGAAAPEEKQPVLLGSFQGLQERVLPATDNRNPQNRTVQVCFVVCICTCLFPSSFSLSLTSSPSSHSRRSTRGVPRASRGPSGRC